MLVEERVGERRFHHAAPLTLSLSPLRGARGRHPTISLELVKKSDALAEKTSILFEFPRVFPYKKLVFFSYSTLDPYRVMR